MNGATPPSCVGLMNLSFTQAAGGGPIALSGSWNCTEDAVDCRFVQASTDPQFQCLSFSGPATGQIVTGGQITLDLTTRPGFSTRMTGTATASSIVGTCAFSDQNIPFTATFKQ
jgi:hypothetical protein